MFDCKKLFYKGLLITQQVHTVCSLLNTDLGHTVTHVQPRLICKTPTDFDRVLQQTVCAKLKLKLEFLLFDCFC